MRNGNNIVTLEVGAVGWDHDSWCDEFYPEDLPREWRLPYYANEYRAVFIPEVYWLHTNLSDIRQWFEDVPDGFRFYFRLNPASTDLTECFNVNQLILSLAEKMGGWVVDEGASAKDSLVAQISAWSPETRVFGLSNELIPGVLRCWRGLNAITTVELGVLKFDVQPELRSLRKLIEQFIKHSESDNCVLFIDGDFSILRNAAIVGRILGS